ncbi:hypothetical protein [Phyllobacterium calauticae]|jgi:hypothetical protein|uniref:hypothetical protein n=1 Tax=Phyllobacterium calauticae TaxID=2817027 RepID=UPI001CBE320C|nr:hypothetical protein [Phyllobacterium calauticae]MBZ3693231.1 hypothetical protein [Phyllobacterium calauticae]
MTTLIDMKPGQYALAFQPQFFDDRKSLVENVEMLRYRGSGWEWAVNELFTIRVIGKVMPKTYGGIDISSKQATIRLYRDAVVAVSDSETELAALRDRLIAIGEQADTKIEEETARRMAPFIRKARSEAVSEIRKTLPHIFGRAS